MNEGSENSEGKQESSADHADIDEALLGGPDVTEGSRRHWFRWAWIGLGVLLVLGAGVAIWPSLRPEIERLVPSFGGGPNATTAKSANAGDQTAARLDAFDQRLSAVESTVQAMPVMPDLQSRLAADNAALAALKKQVAGLQAALAANADLAAKLAAVEKKLAGLQKTGGGGADAAALATFDKKIKSVSQTVDMQNETISDLQKQVSQVAALAPAVRAAPRHIALVLAVVELEQASRRSAPFPDALRSVVALAPQGPGTTDAFGALTDYAASGVPSAAKLRRDFPKVADRVVGAGREKPGTWWQKVFDQLSGLITVRRVGEVTGSTPGDIVARAEVRLQDNDLRGAVQALQELKDGAAVAAQPWLKGAKARLAVDRAVAVVRAETFGALAKAASQP